MIAATSSGVPSRLSGELFSASFRTLSWSFIACCRESVFVEPTPIELTVMPFSRPHAVPRFLATLSMAALEMLFKSSGSPNAFFPAPEEHITMRPPLGMTG